MSNAPDKIYVETGGYDKRRDSVVGYAFDSYSESQPNEIEYIRKDALLEWAKEQSSHCDSSVAMRRAYDQLIEKLQEL